MKCRSIFFACMTACSTVPKSPTLLPTPVSEARVRILAIGDWGSGTSAQNTVAELLEKLCTKDQTDAIVMLGDNFYPSGVSGVQDSLFKTRFEETYLKNKACLSGKKFYVVLGNHDYEGNEQAQIEYSKINSSWIMPAKYFNAKFGKVAHLFFFDTVHAERCIYNPLCLWNIKDIHPDIDKNDAVWKVAIGHHPVQSVVDDVAREPLKKQFFGKRLCENGIHAYIAGHSHNLQYNKVTIDGCVLDQFVSGGGGADLEAIESPGNAVFSASAHGVLELIFDTTSFRSTFFDLENRRVYEIIKRRQ